jgi:hypothetical protein
VCPHYSSERPKILGNENIAGEANAILRTLPIGRGYNDDADILLGNAARILSDGEVAFFDHDTESPEIARRALRVGYPVILQVNWKEERLDKKSGKKLPAGFTHYILATAVTASNEIEISNPGSYDPEQDAARSNSLTNYLNDRAREFPKKNWKVRGYLVPIVPTCDLQIRSNGTNSGTFSRTATASLANTISAMNLSEPENPFTDIPSDLSVVRLGTSNLNVRIAVAGDSSERVGADSTEEVSHTTSPMRPTTSIQLQTTTSSRERSKVQKSPTPRSASVLSTRAFHTTCT